MALCSAVLLGTALGCTDVAMTTGNRRQRDHHTPKSAECEQSQPQHQPSPHTGRGMGTQGQVSDTSWDMDRG